MSLERCIGLKTIKNNYPLLLLLRDQTLLLRAGGDSATEVNCDHHVTDLFTGSPDVLFVELIGTLSKDDVDENENAKQTIGIMSKNNGSSRSARAFCIFVPVLSKTTT